MTRNDANILSSIASQTSPRGRLESLDSGVEGLEGLDQMDHLSHMDHMDHLLPDLGLLTSDQCPLGNDGPYDPPAGKTSVQLKKTNILIYILNTDILYTDGISPFSRSGQHNSGRPKSWVDSSSDG